MKKKIIAVMLLSIIGIVSLTACKEKDTGVLVSVGDNENDSSKNGKTDETNDAKDTEQSKTVTVTASDNIVGVWATEDGNIIYEFTTDGNVYYYNDAIGETGYGTYESDSKSYLSMNMSIESLNQNTDESENATVDYAYEDIVSNPDGTYTVNYVNSNNEVVASEVMTEEQVNERFCVSEEEASASNEIKYDIVFSSTTDEYGQALSQISMTNGDNNIVLIQQY